MKVATFLWSLLWLLNGLPHNSLPHSHLKNGGMRLKAKWLKTELRTRFWSFKMCCKDIVTSCFTSLKSLLINFSGLTSRYWPWLLWHNLLHRMSYLRCKQYTVWFLDFWPFYQGQYQVCSGCSSSSWFNPHRIHIDICQNVWSVLRLSERLQYSWRPIEKKTCTRAVQGQEWLTY